MAKDRMELAVAIEGGDVEQKQIVLLKQREPRRTVSKPGPTTYAEQEVLPRYL